jgi:hypothetical protein
VRAGINWVDRARGASSLAEMFDLTRQVKTRAGFRLEAVHRFESLRSSALHMKRKALRMAFQFELFTEAGENCLLVT